jgi:hypothetical protein
MNKAIQRDKVRRKRRPAWPLSKVVAVCRSAPAVWLALQNISEERRTHIVTPTRTDLSQRCGVARANTISRALSTLEEAGWLEREHVPVFEGAQRVATLLRIVLRKQQISPHTKPIAVGNRKRCKGMPQNPCQRDQLHSHKNRCEGKPQKLWQDSSKEEGAHDAAPACCGAAARPGPGRGVSAPPTPGNMAAPVAPDDEHDPLDPKSNVPMSVALAKATKRNDRAEIDRINSVWALYREIHNEGRATEGAK